MATEGPLMKDGAQCTAAANYWNPGSALDGPNGSGQFLAVYISAARTVTVVATAGLPIYGILQNTPASGQAADVGILGLSKAVAGNAVTADQELMTDTAGRLIPWTSGSGYTKVGRAIEAASAAGTVFLVQLYGGNIQANAAG